MLLPAVDLVTFPLKGSFFDSCGFDDLLPTAPTLKNSCRQPYPAYQKNHQDTTLVQLYAEKAEKIYITADPDSGMTCVTKGLELAQRIHYKHGELKMLTLKAVYLNRRGGLVESIKISFDVIPQATKTNDQRVLAQAYNNLGLCYQVLKKLS